MSFARFSKYWFFRVLLLLSSDFSNCWEESISNWDYDNFPKLKVASLSELTSELPVSPNGFEN